MPWKSQLDAELSAAAARGIPQPPEQVAVVTPAGRFTCELYSVDAVGCAVAIVALETGRLANCTIAQLKSVSDLLSRQINYLLEPISTIETDPDGAAVQMRSNPPHKDDDGTKYYELLVRRDGLSLRRYGLAKGATRQVIPANLTREVLRRLAADFVAGVP